MPTQLVYCLNYELITLSRSLLSTQDVRKAALIGKTQNLLGKVNTRVLQKVLQKYCNCCVF